MKLLRWGNCNSSAVCFAWLSSKSAILRISTMHEIAIINRFFSSMLRHITTFVFKVIISRSKVGMVECRFIIVSVVYRAWAFRSWSLAWQSFCSRWRWGWRVSIKRGELERRQAAQGHIWPWGRVSSWFDQPKKHELLLYSGKLYMIAFSSLHDLPHMCFCILHAFLYLEPIITL